MVDFEFLMVKFFNFEFFEVFKMVIDLGKKEGVDVLIVVDFDVDWLGIVVC